MIDVHSHFFNLKYLPVAGIIRRYTHNVAPHIIAIGIERLLLRGTESSLPLTGLSAMLVAADNKSITGKMPLLHLLNKPRPDGGGKPILHLTEEESLNRILNKVTENDITDDLVLQALDAFQAIEAAGNNQPHALDVNMMVSTEGTMAHLEDGIDKLGRMLQWLAGKIEHGANFIRWFAFMQSSEHEMVRHISTLDEPGIDMFIHQMMDVDNYFNDSDSTHRYRSFYDQDVRVRKMEMLARQFPGKLLGMVAFDPSRSNCIDIIDKAIRERGFVGVKFYPPMGYRAFGDPRYAANIDKLFDYCIANDVPIFTHCTKDGFEANPSKHTGHNSNPMFWKQALMQERYKNLRLCLAHAGGNKGWFAENNEADQVNPRDITDLPDGIDEHQNDWNSSYAKIVYQLCLDFPNVYCDAAYLDEVTEKDKQDIFRIRLQKLFAAQPAFSKKIIYGSDWHMLFQEGKNARYHQDYIDLMNHTGFTQQTRDDFFVNNARSYLKLTIPA